MIGIYLQAVFEIFVGYNFIMSPAALHNGYTPADGFETYALESFGLANIFYGVLLLAKGYGDVTMLRMNVLWNVLWAGYLYTHLANTPWRPESKLSIDTQAFAAPIAAHAVFAVVSLYASFTSGPPATAVHDSSARPKAE